MDREIIAVMLSTRRCRHLDFPGFPVNYVSTSSLGSIGAITTGHYYANVLVSRARYTCSDDFHSSQMRRGRGAIVAASFSLPLARCVQDSLLALTMLFWSVSADGAQSCCQIAHETRQLRWMSESASIFEDPY